MVELLANPLELEQGTEAWLEARLGRCTASRFKDVLATIKSGESAARRNYRAELVVERLTGRSGDRFSNQFMDFGSETEALARVEYTLQSGNEVEEVGLYLHPTLQAGASPDGLVGKDGLVEIKCRQIALHIQALRNNEMPSDYVAQVQGQLWITGRQWCDFVSFAPELPENAQLFIQRIYRDDAYIANLEMNIKKFLQEVNEEVGFVSNYKRS